MRFQQSSPYTAFSPAECKPERPGLSDAILAADRDGRTGCRVKRCGFNDALARGPTPRLGLSNRRFP